MHIEETTVTLFTVNGETYRTRAEAERAAAQADAEARIVQYIEARGLSGRNAAQVRNTLLAYEVWRYEAV